MLIVQRTVPFSECTKYPWLENINMEIECFENVQEHIPCKCKYLCKLYAVFALWRRIRYTVLSELRASRLHLCIVWEQLWRRKLSGFCVPVRFFPRNIHSKDTAKGAFWSCGRKEGIHNQKKQNLNRHYQMLATKLCLTFFVWILRSYSRNERLSTLTVLHANPEQNRNVLRRVSTLSFERSESV